MNPEEPNNWRYDKAITVTQKGFKLLLAALIPMNPEEPLIL